MSEILQHLQHLSRRELLALIREATIILEAREDEEDWELAPEQEAELKRRLDEYERDGFAGDEWPVVKARILAQTSATIAAA